MRDLIFKLRSRNISVVSYHILAWCLFIAYEVSLAAAIRERFNHFADYLLHYLLYITLFYTHCYLLLSNIDFKKLYGYWKLIGWLSLEIIAYYACCQAINNILTGSNIPVNIPDSSSRLFHLATVYRCIYILGLSTAFRITINYVKNQKRIHAYVTRTLIDEKEKETLRAELASSELAFLRSQINPHLIFNALNSVYNRIRKKDLESAEHLMALAELMQYAIKSKNPSDEVFIGSELAHIRNYLTLQQTRYGCEIIYTTSVENNELKIIPLLLFTLVENIFQHGELTSTSITPRIKINVIGGVLTIVTRNEIRREAHPGNGIGLTNVTKRLDRRYPGRYHLEYSSSQNIFSLTLTINLP